MDIMQPAMQFEAGACCQNRCLTGIQPQADLTKHTSLLARMQEIARIMAGDSPSKLMLQSAREALQQAQEAE